MLSFLIILTLLRIPKVSSTITDHDFGKNDHLLKFLCDLSQFWDEKHPGHIAVSAEENSPVVDPFLRKVQVESGTRTVLFDQSTSLRFPSGYLQLLYVFASARKVADLSLMKTLRLHSCRTRIVVVSNGPLTENATGKFFETAWRENFYNILVTSGNAAKIFTYNKFLSDRPEETTAADVSRLFPNKFRDMNGHALRFLALKEDDYSKGKFVVFPNGTRRYYGPEISLFRAISAHLNASIEISSPDEFLKNEKNPWRQANSNESVAGVKARILREGKGRGRFKVGMSWL